MNILPKSLQKVIEEFSKLPGIGNKSASRLAFYLINQPKETSEEFGKALLDLNQNLKKCQSCFNITENEICVICSDLKRDKSTICVVEHPLDVLAIEKTGEYNGIYHILGGAISPVDGIGPDDLRIEELLKRIGGNGILEIILATNPSLEGEATALYIQKEVSILKLKNTKVTRIARGLPVGGDLEYADEITLSRAFEGRKEY
jgi:recombination protein RecR